MSEDWFVILTKKIQHMNLSKKLLLALTCFSGLSFAQVVGTDIFINEIHYDNVGGDINEGFEIAGPAGIDLSTYTVTLYNGNGGVAYNSIPLSGVIPNQMNGYGTVCFTLPANGMQNGSPDGLALSDGLGGVQFLSYEGVIAATDGPAIGLTSVDIIVVEGNSTPVGFSLQLMGIGTQYGDFTWVDPASETPCAINNYQFFTGGCDSYVFITDSGCDSYISPSGNHTWTASGTYLDTIANTVACDSIMVFDITIYPTFDVNDAVTICDGTTYTFGAQSLTTAGTYTEVFQSIDGCDSTVHLTLSTVTTFTTNLIETICDNESYNVGTNTYNTTGNYSVTLLSSLGCDSTVNLDLTVLPTFTTTLSPSVCGSYTSPSGNYTWTASGTYNDTMTSIQNGCDSIFVIDLTVSPTDLIVFNESACDSYVFEGNTYTQSGTYDVVFQNQFMCDSIRRLNLIITNTPAVPSTSGNQSLCDGDTPSDVTITGNIPPSLMITGVLDGPLSGGLPKMVEFYAIDDIADLSIYGFGSANNGGGTNGVEFTFPNVSLNAGDFYYVGTDSTGFNTYFGFYPNAAHPSAGNVNGDDAIELFEGTTVIDVFGDINMDGSGTAWDYLDGWANRNIGSHPNLGVWNINEWSFSGIDALDGESSWSASATPYPLGAFSTSSQLATYNWYDDVTLTNLVNTGSSYTPSISAVGSETVYVTATIGACSSASEMVEIVINSLPPVSAGNDQTVCEGSSVTLSGSGADTYTWSPAITDNTPFTAPSANTTYTVTGIDANGCENTDQVDLFINQLPSVSYTDITQICVYNDAIILAAATPAGGTYSGTGVTGTTFDPAVAGIGAAVITYSYTDGNGCTNDAQWTINVDGCAGIIDADLQNSMFAYPNPTSGNITISGLKDDTGTLWISDLSGKIIATVQTIGSDHVIDLDNFEPGTYMIQYSGSNDVIKVVKR